ncbi:MAG: hypothetical protein ACI9NT_001921, partial [Bacteroidia bacterium]
MFSTSTGGVLTPCVNPSVNLSVNYKGDRRV